ncbi:MAG: DUF2254 domain-containing protein [Chloroflexi bacterium]|nr:DUF2254 domain-containing protein [Chloroflexota bacterium]
MRRLLPWIVPFVALVIVVSGLSVISAVLGDPAEHSTLGALGSVQFVLNTNAAALTSAMAVLIALVLLTVQLTAQRYSFSVIGIFVQDPVNSLLIGLFIITIVFNLWLGLVLKETYIPVFATLVGMVLMTLCFAMLPPYILYLFEVIRPDNILDHIQQRFLESVMPVEGLRQVEQRRAMAMRRISQMGDIARTAVNQSDGAVARHAVWALYWSIASYLERKATMPPAWFSVEEHQFRGRHELIVREIEETMTWVEVRMLDELREVFFATLNKLHDVNTTVALVLRLLGEKAVERNDVGLSVGVMKFFNTVLRAAINQGDVRAGYHVLYQYRLMADTAMIHHPDMTLQIAHRLSYYGDAAAGGPLLWMSAAAAYDLRILAESALEHGAGCDVAAAIIGELIDTVRRGEAKRSPALTQLYKMTLALGAFCLAKGEPASTQLLAHALASVPPPTLDAALSELLTIDDPVFWELTDRVVNFDYVEPEARGCLPAFRAMVPDAALAVEDGAVKPGAAAPASS